MTLTRAGQIQQHESLKPLVDDVTLEYQGPCLAGWSRCLVPDADTTIEERHVEIAREALIRRRDMHVDSLIDVLREERCAK